MNAYRKDTEAASKWLLEGLERKRKWARDWPVEYLVWLATWAGHWARLELGERS